MKNEFHHLLVIRLSAMGDVAMTVPILSALVKKYPELRLTVLTKQAYAPLYEGIPKLKVYIAEVNGRHRGIKGLWRLYKELLKLKVHAVADLHNVIRSNILKRYFILSGIKTAQLDKGRREKRALTATRKKVFAPVKSTLQRYCDVFETLGYSIDLATVRPLSKKPLGSEILDLIGKNNLKWIGIAPFAAYPGKTYPYPLMEQVIMELDRTRAYRIFLFGGGEKESAILKKTAGKCNHTLNMAGVTDLHEELSLISNLDLMVSMDSANAHLAAMYGIPTITIWGVTHPYAGFYPFGQDPANAVLSDRSRYPLIPTSIYGNKVPRGYEKVMEIITPQEVLAKIRILLGETQ